MDGFSKTPTTDGPGPASVENQIPEVDVPDATAGHTSACFSDLTVPADELCKYGFIGYIPNTDLMDSGPDYGRMFIVKDHLCE